MNFSFPFNALSAGHLAAVRPLTTLRVQIAGWLSPGAFWDLGLSVGLALLPWLYFWRLFAPNRADQMTVAEGDFTGGQFPLLLTVARSLHDGVAPLWNSYSSGGTPLLAHPQAGALYPLNPLTFAAMRGWGADSFLALEQQIPLHIALAAVFTYALGRVLIGSRVGSVVAAITFAYSGFLTSYPIPQLPILRSATWFPLEILAWWLALQRVSPAWAAVTGLAVGIAFLGGHPQTVFQQGVGLAVIAGAWSCLQMTTGRCFRVINVLTLGTLACAIAAGITAAQWLPTRELEQLSSRAEEGYNFRATGFSLWEIPMDLLAPSVLGGFPPYVGTFSPVLAALGFALNRSWLHAVMTPLAIAGLLLALGGQTFLYPALYTLLPGFDLFRNQERAIFLFTMAVALLAGAGAAAVLDQLGWRGRAGLRRFTRAIGMLLLLAIATGAALYVGHISAEVANRGFQRWRDVIHAFFFFVFVLGCAWALLLARLRMPSLGPALPALVVTLVIFDLFSVTADRQFVRRPVDSATHEPQVVQRLLGDIGPGKALERDILSGNHGLMYGIPAVNSTFPLRLARVDSARARLPEPRFLDLLNVTHLIVQREDPILRESGTAETLTDAGYVLFRRAGSPGPAYIVPDARRAASADEALETV
ncbi:MAG: hypothetical protein HY534_05475, partial [Chloroflexi bacterium]|nr:hypothetical protein [Chloroflexota bacterium]